MVICEISHGSQGADAGDSMSDPICSVCQQRPATSKVGNGWFGTMGCKGDPYCDKCLDAHLSDIAKEEEQYEWRWVKKDE